LWEYHFILYWKALFPEAEHCKAGEDAANEYFNNVPIVRRLSFNF